jgi:hypothetical protein
MSMRPARLGFALSLLALGFLQVSSCSHHEDPDPDRDRTRRDTPEHAIACLATSLEAKSIDDYSSCLAAGYRFVFQERDWDTAGVTSLEPYWGLTEDVEATANMFSSSHTLGIVCDLPVEMMLDSGDDFARCLCDVDLQVTIDHGGPEPSTYWVDRSWLIITLVADPDQPDLWVISEIEETLDTWLLTRSGSLPQAEEICTVGSIKAMFK